ncbi:MAG: transporter substrate-binding domain-containing protein, partial [Magnetococcales bacterium]|nr:transporter substrate-binding domain-containing protein [Magnetococcales bacterium]
MIFGYSHGRKGRCQLPLLLFCIGLTMVLFGCDWRLPSPTITRIHDRGVLIVATRNAPTTWYLGRDANTEGFEHDLAQAFARHMHLELQFKVYNSHSDILQALEDGSADLAAAGMSRFDDHEGHFQFGPVYQQVNEQVVCRRGGPRPNNLLQLADIHLVVSAG